MSQDLYQQAIMDHARSAVGGGRLKDPDASVTVDNPLCGDRVTVDVKLVGGRIEGLAHHVRGCALCQAAASVIGARAPGRAADELGTLRQGVAAMLENGAPPPWPELSAFGPVGAYKSRHECVLLPFEALEEALTAANAAAGD